MEDVNNLLSKALDFLRQGDVESAETEFAGAVSACCEAYGETDIVTARTLAHLARVSSLRGKKDIACQMYARILRIHEALPQPVNCDHAIALSELAVIREEGGSQVEADKLRGRADGIMNDLSSRVHASAKSDATDSSDDSSSNESSGEDDRTESSLSDGHGDTTPTTTAGSMTGEETPVRRVCET